jgi:hypothetical protein
MGDEEIMPPKITTLEYGVSIHVRGVRISTTRFPIRSYCRPRACLYPMRHQVDTGPIFSPSKAVALEAKSVNFLA